MNKHNAQSTAKFTKHSSIKTLNEVFSDRFFSVSIIKLKNVINQINSSKITQDTDILIKILKENATLACQ